MDNEQNLAPGDVVMLKSGGPPMTIEDIDKFQYSEHDKALCSWFEGKQRKSDVFELSSLEKVDRDHPPRR